MILKTLQNLPQYAKIVLVVMMIFVSVLILFIGHKKLFISQSDTAFSMLEQAYCQNLKLLKSRKPGNPDSLELNKSQLDELYKRAGIIENYKQYNKYKMSLYMKNQYSLLTLFTFLSGIAGLCTFVIINKGWAKSNIYLKTTFLTITTLAAFAGIYPEVYNQDESIESHMTSFEEYYNIQNKIFHYSGTAPLLYGKQLTFNQFIDSINSQESSLFNLHYKVHKKSIDTKFLNDQMK